MTRDHPRACGEKRLTAVVLTVSQGSPPRVRGKVASLCGRRKAVGITPARAGKRVHPPCLAPASRDHPRACGEKPGVRSPPGLKRGSPPRVRGKVAQKGAFDVRLGITPARAGKSHVYDL